MKIEFPYVERGGQLFPIIEVGIGYESKKFRFKALIDSGASLSVFRPEVADALGIKLIVASYK